MRRRELIRIAGAALFAWPAMARAQQAGKVSRIGYLRFSSAAADANNVEALRAGLRALGHVEGKNLVIEFRWAETVEQLQEAAAQLVRMKVDVIFALSSTETERARQATNTIPIIFASHADPVGLGHVASLSRPGGNITGLSVVQSEFTAKSVEILKETVPHATRFGVLWTPTAPQGALPCEPLKSPAKSLAFRSRAFRCSSSRISLGLSQLWREIASTPFSSTGQRLPLVITDPFWLNSH